MKKIFEYTKEGHIENKVYVGLSYSNWWKLKMQRKSWAVKEKGYITYKGARPQMTSGLSLEKDGSQETV